MYSTPSTEISHSLKFAILFQNLGIELSEKGGEIFKECLNAAAKALIENEQKLNPIAETIAIINILTTNRIRLTLEQCTCK